MSASTSGSHFLSVKYVEQQGGVGSGTMSGKKLMAYMCMYNTYVKFMNKKL